MIDSRIQNLVVGEWMNLYDLHGDVQNTNTCIIHIPYIQENDYLNDKYIVHLTDNKINHKMLEFMYTKLLDMEIPLTHTYTKYKMTNVQKRKTRNRTAKKLSGIELCVRFFLFMIYVFIHTCTTTCVGFSWTWFLSFCGV